MSNNISIYLMFLALLFSQLAASEQNYSNPFEDMILAGNSSLALSENLNEKRYSSLLQTADYTIDAAIVSLSAVLPVLPEDPIRDSIKRYLSNAKEHRIKYPSTAIDTDIYQQSLTALESIQILPPKYTDEELQEKKDNILKRLDNLKQRIGSE